MLPTQQKREAPHALDRHVHRRSNRGRAVRIVPALAAPPHARRRNQSRLHPRPRAHPHPAHLRRATKYLRAAGNYCPRRAGSALRGFARQQWKPPQVMSVTPDILALAKRSAISYALDPALVCAVVEQESSWNTWAMRYEPAFFAKYVASLYTNNKITASEAYARGFSWGLMQVMGQVARETGFDAPFLSALCDPEQGLLTGCKVLRKKFDAMANDTTRALLAWN